MVSVITFQTLRTQSDFPDQDVRPEISPFRVFIPFCYQQVQSNEVRLAHLQPVHPTPGYI